MICNYSAEQNNFTSNLISNSDQINVNFDSNFVANFDETDKIIKIDESDQTENFDQSDNLYQINDLHQINKFLSKIFLSSFSLEDAYKADCQMQSSADRISKFLSSGQEYQHDQQNSFQNSAQIVLISLDQN